MAVAPLSRVVLTAPTDEAGALVGRLLASGAFHPAQQEGLTEDLALLELGSRAQATYGRANELLAAPPFAGRPKPGPSVIRYPSADVGEVLTDFEEDLGILEREAGLAREREDVDALAGILGGIRDDSLDLFHAIARLRTRPGPPGTITVEGYVPTRGVTGFREALGPYLVSATPVERRTAEDAYVPTLLVNPRMIRLFEQMTTQRGIPKYSEIDPTPIVAFVFPLFFGIMFGDLGHGLTLLGVGAYLVVATRYDYWGRLILAFGVSSGIVGFLRGDFFGVAFSTPFHQLLALPPALNASLTFTYLPLLLEVALFIGTIHLSSAYLLAVLNQVRSRRWGDLLTDGAPTLVLYVSLIPLALALAGTAGAPGKLFSSPAETPFFEDFFGLALPIATVAWATVPLVLGAFAALALGPAARRFLRTRRTRKLLSSLGEGAARALTRPAEFALNTLSYIRLAALLVTNTLLSGLVAGARHYGPPGLVIAALLNLALMAMEGVIIYLQDMRLHWLEWLPRFYSGTGTAFAPLVARGARMSISPRASA